MATEREQAYAAAEVAYDNANRGDIYANPGPLRAAIDAVWNLAVAEGRRQAARDLREEANRYSPNVVAEAQSTMQYAARIAEGGAP